MEIQLAQIIFQAINFLIVLFVLTRFIYKPVIKLLEERKKKIADSAEAAQEVLTEKEGLEQFKEESVKKANQKAKSIEDEIRKEAQADAKLLLAKSKEDLALKEAKFTEELNKLKKEELKAMDSEIKQAALSIAEKVVGESIDKKKQQKIIDQQLDEIIKSL